MKPYLIQEDTLEDHKRLQRLQESVEVYSLRLQELAQNDLHEHYLIIPGIILSRLNKDDQERLLRQQVDLLFIPPFPSDRLDGLFTAPSQIYLKSETFSSIKVKDEELLSEINRGELDIFFQKVICAKPSRTLLTTASGESVLVCTQARSTWGRLLITTLMLTSLSARSNETHKKIFWDGLSSWLTITSPTPIRPHATQFPVILGEDINLLLFLLATQLAQRDENIKDEDLQNAYEHVQKKLQQDNNEFDIKIGLQLLVNQGIISQVVQGEWHVDPEKLSTLINSMHLNSLLRRLM
jgi:hypothetical protein